jgi:glycosyltransferase involved in cell wall biosynthesis
MAAAMEPGTDERGGADRFTYSRKWSGLTRTLNLHDLPARREEPPPYWSQTGVDIVHHRSMKIWGVSMVKDEADIIEITISNLFVQGVDHLLIADNMSTDGTREILEKLARTLPISIVDDLETAYWQSEKMTRLARQAAAAGAEWIIPFDADEIWRAYRGSVRDAIENTDAEILVAQMFNHYPRPTLRRGTIPDRHPWNRTFEFAKVAFKWRPGLAIVDGNHDVLGTDAERRWGELLIDHYPHRSWKQYRRKMRQGAAAVSETSVARFVSMYWRQYGAMSDWRLRLAWWRIRTYPRLRRRDRG